MVYHIGAGPVVACIAREGSQQAAEHNVGELAKMALALADEIESVYPLHPITTTERRDHMLRKAKTSETAEALRKVPLFAPCTDEELNEIAGLAADVEVKDGQVLCTEGSIGHEFFVLTEGTASVTTQAGTSASVGAGDFVGELALLDDGPRTATVTMTSDGRVLDMSGTEFRSLLRAAPTIAVRMLPVLAARLRASGAG